MMRSAVSRGLIVGVAVTLAAGGVPASAETSAGGATQVVFASDFEDGTTQGWFGRGSAEVSVSADEAHTGQSSLLTTRRADTWQGPGHDMLTVLEPGVTYE